MVKCHSSKVNFSVRFWVSALICGENWYSIRSHKPDSVVSITTPATIKFLIMEEKTRILECVTSKTLRGIVEFINDRQIKKEDLFYLDKDRGEYSLLYFK